MIVIDVQQGTKEWQDARLGIPTASQFSRIMTPKTRKASTSADKYMCELIAARILGRPVDDASTEFMLRGTMLEESAVAAYEFERDCETRKVGFILDDGRRWGCSPDRLVGDDGLLEIKCPSAAVHVAALLGMNDDDHVSQVQGQLMVTGRAWDDLSFFNPSMPRRVSRIGRDETYVSALYEHLQRFCDRLDEATARVRSEWGESAKEVLMDGPDGHAPELSDMIERGQA